MRVSRLAVLGAVLIAAALWVLPRWCGTDRREAIRVDEGRVVVTNLSGGPWSDVTLWLNDYYRAQAPSLAPGQRLEVPLDVFVAGLGQQFDRSRQSPAGIEVTARAADGQAIRLTWGTGRRR